MVAQATEARICLAASAGGHVTQLLELRRAWDGYSCFSVTTSPAVQRQLAQFGPVYITEESNRQRPIRVLKSLIQCARILRKERPSVVISTGAAVGCIVAVLGKLGGARVLWIDSIANVERLSLSGRLVRPFADLMLTQWPDLAKRYKSVEYVGQIV